MNSKDHLKWALTALELAQNGLKYGLKVADTDNPATCSTELWNVRTAMVSIKSALAILDEFEEEICQREAESASIHDQNNAGMYGE